MKLPIAPLVYPHHLDILLRVDCLQRYDAKGAHAAQRSPYAKFIADKKRGKGIRTAIPAVSRFIDTYNDIKKNGMRKPVTVIEHPKGYKAHLPPKREMPTSRVLSNYSIVDGGHRLAIMFQLGCREIECEVIRPEKPVIIPDYTTFMVDNGYDVLSLAKLLPSQYWRFPTQEKSIRKLRDYIWNYAQEHSVRFGKRGFYTDSPDIGLVGQRNTLRRLELYEFKRFIQPDWNVLEIGANTGFIAMYLAEAAEKVYAVENDPVAFHILKNVASNGSCVPRANIKPVFKSALKIDGQYDCLVSLAVHHWLKIPWALYVSWIRQRVRIGGLVLVESHNLARHDSDWMVKIEYARQNGFVMLRHTPVDDDSKMKRAAVWLERVR